MLFQRLLFFPLNQVKALFYLLPRLIEIGPKLCTSEEWVERRKHLFNVA